MTLAKAKENLDTKNTLPHGWNWVLLEDLFDVKQGAAMSPVRRQGIAPRPFLRTLNVLWGSVDLSNLDKMDFAENEVASLNLRNGDLLVCEGGDVGRTAIWKGELDSCLYQNHIHRLRRRHNNVAPEFYAYWMQAAYKVFQSYTGKEITTTIPNLSGSKLKSFMVPLPPTLAEQERIAHILNEQMTAIEKARAAAEVRLEAAKALPAAYLRVVFESEEARDWPNKRIGEICTVRGGKRLPKGTEFAHTKTNFPYIRVVDFEKGNINLHGLKYLEEDTRSQISRYIINRNDVYLSIAGTIGVAGIIPDTLDGANLTENAARLIIMDKSNLFRDYLARFLQSRAGQDSIKQRTNAVGQPKLALERIETIEIPVPLISRQRELAHELDNQLSEANNLIKTLEQELEAINALPAALLRRAFTGGL